MNSQLTLQERIEFINSIELPESPKLSEGIPPVGRISNSSDGAPSAFVTAGGVSAAIGDVTRQQTQDVLDSMLFAQLVANRAFDRYDKTDAWYKEYQRVLENIGWVLTNFNFQQYNSSSQSFTISDAVISTLRTLIGSSSPIFSFANEVISALGMPDNTRQMLNFQNTSLSSKSGNFQAMPYFFDPITKSLTCAFVGSYFNVTRSTVVTSCSRYQKQQIELFTSGQLVVLNEMIYGDVRNAIRVRLGSRAEEFIIEVDI